MFTSNVKTCFISYSSSKRIKQNKTRLLSWDVCHTNTYYFSLYRWLLHLERVWVMAAGEREWWEDSGDRSEGTGEEAPRYNTTSYLRNTMNVTAANLTENIHIILLKTVNLLDNNPHLEWWRDYWTVSDVIEQSGVTERYLANAIISDKSKWR